MAAQIGYFDTLKSAAGKVFAYLASITLTGTDGKIVTVTQNTSLDEAVAMSSKAPKASPVFTTRISTPMVVFGVGLSTYQQAAYAAALAANADLTVSTNISGSCLVLVRDASGGGTCLLLSDSSGTGTTVVSDQTGGVIVGGADPGAGTSKLWVNLAGSTVIVRNRFVGARNVRASLISAP